MSLDLSTAISALRWIIPIAAKEGKNLLQVPDDVRRVARDLEATLIFLEEIDGRRLVDQNSRLLSYFVEKMRLLAFRSEDVIDTYLANFDHKISNANLFMKSFCICINAYPIHTIGEEIKEIQLEMEEQRRNFDFGALIGGREGGQQQLRPNINQEDLIRDSDRQNNLETLEDAGFRFLDELHNRCLLIIDSRDYDGKMLQFQLHDLLRDFCVEKSKKENFFEVLPTSDDQEATRATTLFARRIILLSSDRGIPKLPILRKTEGGATTGVGHFDVGIADNPALRSIVHVGGASSGLEIRLRRFASGPDDQPSLSLKIIAQDFRLLKVLYLSGLGGLFVPDQISDLKLLKYLKISRCQVAGKIFSSPSQN